MAAIDLDANDPFNPLAVTVTVGVAVIALPETLPGATRTVSVSASGRLTRIKACAASSQVSATVFVADMLLGVALDSRVTGYNITGLNYSALDGIVYPDGEGGFSSTGSSASPSTGSYVTLTPVATTWYVIAKPVVHEIPFEQWSGTGDTPADVVTWFGTGGGPLSVVSTPVPGSWATGFGEGTVGRKRSIAATAAVSCSQAAGLRVGSFLFSSTQFPVVTASASLDRRQRLRSTEAVAVAGQAYLSNLVVIRAADNLAFVSARACFDAGRDGLGVCDLIREILLAWGIENPERAPGWARRRALHDLNAAMQIVWNQAKDRTYWTRSTLSLTLASGISSQPLGDTIQNVVGPARINGTRQPLVLLGTLGEVDQFEDLYLDGDTPASPVAYHVQRENQAGKEPCKCTLHVRPAPTESTDILLDVVLESPRFSWNDMDRCPRVPLPHRYIESLLLPILRYHAMNCHLFVDRARAPQIESEYMLARQGLELADPLPGKAGDNVNRREEART